MKRIKEILAVPLIALTLGGCSPMLKTYRSPRYIGNFVESTDLATGNSHIRTDSMDFIAKGHTNAQLGDSCYAIFEWKSYIHGPKKQSIYLTFPETNGKHEIIGKERNH